MRVPERFGVERGWCGSGRPGGRGGPHVVWEALGVVKVAESWDPTDRDPPNLSHGPRKSPLETPNPPRDPQIPTGLSQLPFDL